MDVMANRVLISMEISSDLKQLVADFLFFNSVNTVELTNIAGYEQNSWLIVVK
jgi:hypothetical protein